MPASSSALLPLCQHRAVRCRSELLEAMRGASTDSNDRYLRATGLEGVRLLGPDVGVGDVDAWDLDHCEDDSHLRTLIKSSMCLVTFLSFFYTN